MTRQLVPGIAFLWCAMIFSTSAGALTLPFAEDFGTDAANWAVAANSDVLMYTSTGGADGGGFASGTFNFVASAEDDGPAVLRATTTPGGPSSGGEFFGNWLGRASSFSYHVRHDAPFPLTFFTRFASPTNFPGAIALHFAPVPPNTWTLLETVIDPSNPQLILEGPPFPAVFGNVGNIQVGVNVSAGLAGLDQEITFDIDQVSVIPEPTAITLVMIALVGLGVRGRQRRV